MPEPIEQDNQDPSPEPKPEPKTLTAEEFNKAYSAREKSTLAKIEKMLKAQSKPAPKAEADDDDGGEDKQVDDPVAKKLNALERRVKEAEKREKDALKASQVARAETALQKELTGKVSEDWIDVALTHVSKHLKSDSDKPTLVFDDLDYSLADGVAEWLKNPANKRFIPPRPTVKVLDGNNFTLSKDDTDKLDEGTRNQMISQLLTKTAFGQ